MIYIWTRSTLDWQDEAAFNAQLPAQLAAPVALWNKHFRLPYHLFRHRLREIALLNHSRVQGAVCADWEDIPDGALVVPVDDDDWFAPDMALTLDKEREAGITAWYWPGHFLEIPVHLRHELGVIRRRLWPSTPDRFLCITNNYAMVKDAASRERLASHVRADAWVRRHMETAVRHIPAHLSLMNRTLASTTTLREKRGPFALPRLLMARHRYRRLYQRAAPAELAWSQPYREMMAELMEAL